MIGLARNLVEGATNSAASFIRGDRDQALIRALDPVSNAAFDIGRRVPNATWREQRVLRRALGDGRPR
jgi:hypothetical protein